MPVILIIEDHPKLNQSIVKILEESGYDTVAAYSLSTARQLMSTAIDAVILDLMLPDGNGLDWLAELRTGGDQTPVLILTARDSVPDRVTGLDKGADDYLIKPFAIDELLARVRALLRRRSQPSAAVLTVGDLTVDLLSRTATRASLILELQNRQFELLVFLMRNAQQVVTREMISREVWKESTATWTNVIEVHINQLRKQLERSKGPAILHTVRGQGYLLGDPP